MDETDTYETNEQTVRVARGGRGGRRASRPDVATFLSLFDHKLRDASALSSAEVQAVAAFLATSVKEFSRFAAGDVVLRGLVRQADVLDLGADGLPASAGTARLDSLDGGAGGAGSFGTPQPSMSMDDDDGGRRSPQPRRAASPPGGSGDPDTSTPRPHTLYTRGEPSSIMTLVLQGRVRVKAGTEGFESELGPWSVLAPKTLTPDSASPPYVPDFDASLLPPARVVRVSAAAYRAALAVGDASAVAAGRAVRQALAGRGGVAPRGAAGASPQGRTAALPPPAPSPQGGQKK